MKRGIGEKYHPRTEKYRKIIKFLRQEAAKMKATQREKYWTKLRMLEKKYREEEEDELAPPLKELQTLVHIFTSSLEVQNQILQR